MLIRDHTLAPESASIQVFWWQGFSQSWYPSTITDVKGFECPEGAVFVVVKRDIFGFRIPLMVGWAENVSEEIYMTHGDRYLRAIAEGANEIHLHLLPQEAWEREAATRDIAAAWSLPVCEPFCKA
ncbi:MAG: hypothetical protein ROR55_25335 [Devosia sp.]